ncbi:MAG TPA: hypothetical protein ENK82_00635 [Campylobacterales bacterium]|nr:hypothetical protein [Campylobacterales bacterium]HHS91829.1 hypothetical protein [Campylobacterales bacterium]
MVTISPTANEISIENSGISSANYSKLLISLNQQDLENGIVLKAGSIKYTQEAQSARFETINKYGWTFNDGGLAP